MVENAVEVGRFIHHREGPGDQIIGDPLRRDSKCHRLAADLVWEYFREKHPADRAPGDCERRYVTQHRQQREKSHLFQEESHPERHHAYGHAQASDNHQRAAAETVHRKDRQYGERKVDHPDDNRLRQRGIRPHAHVAENFRSIVEYHIDADKLLKYGEQHTNHDHPHPIAEQFGFYRSVQGAADTLRFDLSFRGAVDPLQNSDRFRFAAFHNQPAGTFRHTQYQQEQQCRRNHFRKEHQPPAGRGQPCFVTVQRDKIVDEINHQHSENNRKLVPRHQSAAP